MTAFTNGSGGSISGVTTREDFTVAVINLLRINQGNSARNPNGAKNLNITSNTEGSISGSFTSPVTISSGPTGEIVVTAASYLTGVGYQPSSGGDSKATNEVQALINTVMHQKSLELSGTAVNSTNANYLSWSLSMGATGVGGANGTISIAFSGLPVDMTLNANGSITFEGKSYLT